MTLKGTPVTVFGGSLPRPGEPAYDQAQRLGALLGKAGCQVLTGGYIGTMEAVSRGAAEAGGHVIGVTCDEIEAWRAVRPNPWIHEERRFPRLRQRLYALIDGCQAALALPGGIGTLAEVTLMWSQLQTGAIPPRPMILIGSGWRASFESLFQSQGAYIPTGDRRWLSFVPDVEPAFEELVSALARTAP